MIESVGVGEDDQQKENIPNKFIVHTFKTYKPGTGCKSSEHYMIWNSKHSTCSPN